MTEKEPPGRGAFQLFLSFLKIGAFTFGGGWAMVPLIKKEIVENRGWLSDQDFVDLLAVAQSGPGPIAINTACLTGNKIMGARGAVSAVLGSALPSFLVILLVASLLGQFRELPVLDAFFRGMRPAILGLIASALVSVGRISLATRKDVAFLVLAAVLVFGFKLSPIYVILISMGLGAAVGAASRRSKRGAAGEPESHPESQSEGSSEGRGR